MKLTVDMGIKISEVNEQEYNAFIELAKECGCRLYSEFNMDYNQVIDRYATDHYSYIDYELDVSIGGGACTKSGKVNDITKDFKQYYKNLNNTIRRRI